MKKIYNVKFTLLALLMVCLFGVNEKAWGAKPYYNSGDSKWYSLYDESWTSVTLSSTVNKNPDVFPPTKKEISIQWNEEKTAVGCDLYLNDTKIAASAIYEKHTSTQTTKKAVGEDITTVKIGFHATGSGGHFGNFRILLAPHIRFANDGVGTTSVTPTIPDTYVEATTDAIPVTFRSFLTNGDITVKLTSGDKEVFRLGTANNTSGEITASKDGKSYKVGANACAAAGGTANATAGGSTLGDISKYGFNVYFRPKAATTYSGTITITDGTSTATVTLSGKGKLNENSITWTPTTTGKKNWGDQVDANATATNTNYSGNTNSRAITYTVESGKESYVTIADGKITFNQAGAGQSVKITATQEANYKYKKATLEKTFQIKNSQSIVWDPEKVNTNIRLNKTRDIADYTYAEPSNAGTSRTISYSSDKTNIISVSGTVLTAKNVGKANIKATLAGDDDYNEVTSSKEFEVKEKEAVVFSLDNAIITDDNDDLEFTVGQTSKVITSNNTDEAIGYSTTAEKVAIFNTTTKRIEAKGEGSAKITLLQDATDDYQAGNRTLNITVSLNPTTITTNVSEKTMEVGDSYDPALSTNNGEVDMTITTKKSGVVAYVDGKLKALGSGKDTITFTQAKTTKWAKGEKSIIVTVNKKNPILSITGVTSPAWNTTIEPTISSTNTDPNCAITITKVSGSDAAARIFGSTIKVYDKHGENFIFNVSQAGNNTYNSVNKNCTIQVRKPNNHVTFTYGTNLQATKGNYTGIIEFVGVPKSISCNLANDAISDAYYYVEEADSKDGTFVNISESDYKNASSLSESLKPSTRAIKFKFDGALLMGNSKKGTFSNITITERKEILVNGLTNNYYDFGTWEVGNQATDRAIGIKWYSVPTTTVTSSNPGVFDVITETVNSEIDDFSESASIIIRYHHKRVTPGTQDEATITLTSENGYSTSFKVKGKTIKKNQTLIWQDDLSPVEVGTVIPNAAIAPLALNYSITSTTAEGVVDLDGTVLKAQKVGTVKIHVANDGDEMWNPISGECTIKVTDLKVQHIRWNENFTRLTTSDADQELKATAYEYVDGEEVPITARSITYTSSNTGVVSVVNGKLHVVGVGTATLTAWLAGVDGVYEPASVTRNVKVRDKSTGCVPYAIENESANMKTHIYDFTGTEKTYSLNGVEPASLTFTAWRENILGATGGNLFVAESKDNGSSWAELREFSISEGENNATTCGPVALSREATNIKIYKKTGATGYHNFKDLDVTKAKYLELDDTKDKTTMSVSFPAEETHIGQTYIKSVVVNYSNIYDMLYVNHTNANFRITPTEIGERCGENGKATITIIYYAKEAISESDVITITDEHGLTATINVSASVDKNDQTITWEPTTDLNTTDDVTFDATASSGLAVKYELAEGDAEIATLTEDGKLTIKTAGDIHVTASQAGNENLYKSVELDPITFHISKVTPSVSVSPSVETVTLPKTLSGVTLNVSEAKMEDDKENVVTGGYAWKAGSTPLTEGTHNYVVSFTPDNDAWYNVAEFEVSVTASKRDQVITWGVEDNQTVWCSAIIPLNAVLTDDYSHDVMEESLTYESSNEECAEIIEGELIIKTPGTTTIKVSRDADDVYNSASITRTITFKKATPVIDTLPKALSIYEEQWLHHAALSGGYVRSGERKIQGGFVWTTEDFQATVVGTQEYDAVFIPANEECYDRVTCKVPMTVLQVERVFTNKKGDNDWNNPENWSNGFVPPVANVEVTINENVIISDTVSVGTMTIKEGVTVTVTSQLTVSGNQETENGKYGDLVVKETGELIVNNTFKVNNFFLDAKLGNTSTAAASGQVSNGDNLDIQGDVYFQLAVDPSGRNTYGWYDFVVPFEVDVIGGISIAEDPDAEMKFNVNYAVMAFDESKRAVRGKDWNKFTGTMQPGRVYTITLDETKPWNTVVFKKKKGASLTGDRSFKTSYSAGLGEEVDRGWNGFGNGSLFHAELAVDDPETLVQIYDHKNKCYQARPVKDYSIAVGTSFFMQVGSVQTITLVTADEKNTGFMAPARNRKTVEKFKMSLMNYDADEVYDYLWVGANEDATEAYVIGEDVLKMGTQTSSNIARMWTTKGGHNLCAVEAALINDEASTPLAIYAPKAGNYWFAIDEAPEDATLYLTHNGNIIWDLTISPYLFDLSQGTTEGYGLRMEAKKTPAIMTGVEQSEFSDQSSVRKVIIDGKVYIVTPDGKMYDIVGKGIKF